MKTSSPITQTPKKTKCPILKNIVKFWKNFVKKYDRNRFVFGTTPSPLWWHYYLNKKCVNIQLWHHIMLKWRHTWQKSHRKNHPLCTKKGREGLWLTTIVIEWKTEHRVLSLDVNENRGHKTFGKKWKWKNESVMNCMERPEWLKQWRNGELLLRSALNSIFHVNVRSVITTINSLQMYVHIFPHIMCFSPIDKFNLSSCYHLTPSNTLHGSHWLCTARIRPLQNILANPPLSYVPPICIPPPYTWKKNNAS